MGVVVQNNNDIYKGLKRIKTKTSVVISGATLGIFGILSGLAIPLSANAAISNNYTLFGDASIVQPGNASANAAQIESSGTVAPKYGGVDYNIPTGVTTLSTLNNLSTDFKFTQGSCGGGAPRFQATVTTPSGPENVFFYIGTPPNYTGCPPNVWSNTGNLAAPTNLVDATQLGGGFYEPYSAVQTSYGSYPVTDVSVVTDAYWFAGTQTVQVDNTQIDSNTYTYEPSPTKDSCKKDGWKNLQDANGNSFKNQGDCVSYFATNGKNPGNGQ